jgi:tripartite-type tricarboxylate transporter receptor subunit TctC
VLARKDLPPANLREFVSYLKENSSKLNMAHAGAGSTSHLGCLLFNRLTGAKPTMIPFGGTAPAMNALVGNQVDYMCDVTTNAVPQLLAGNIKAYAIATPIRNPMVPNVPTAIEGGLPEFDVSAWSGVFAPKGTPPAIIEKLNAALNTALNDPSVRKRLLDFGSDVPPPTKRDAKTLGELVRSEVARWKDVLN